MYTSYVNQLKIFTLLCTHILPSNAKTIVGIGYDLLLDNNTIIDKCIPAGMLNALDSAWVLNLLKQQFPAGD